MGKIFYIMGKSASGKDRIYSLLAAHKELNLKTLILYTTRPIRAGEQDGKNYAGAIVVVNYEEGDLTYTISYNEDMEMVGFLIK